MGGRGSSGTAAKANGEAEAKQPKKTPAEMVRDAYDAADKPHGGEFAKIADVKDELAKMGMTTAQADAILRSMSRAQDINLANQANQAALTPRDRKAAVREGDQDKHLISFPKRMSAAELKRIDEMWKKLTGG